LRIQRNDPNKEVLKSSSGKGIALCFGGNENQVCLECHKKTAAKPMLEGLFLTMRPTTCSFCRWPTLIFSMAPRNKVCAVLVHDPLK